MQHASNVVAFEFAAQAKPALKAFIVYESVAAGKRAKEICDMVSDRLGDGWKIEIEMSSFKSLRIEEVRQNAAAAVADANIVIFSCRHRDLPADVLNWTKAWPMRTLHSAALVALLSDDAGQTKKTPAVKQFLADAARQRGMDYFSHLYLPAEEIAADSLMTIVRKEHDDEPSCSTSSHDCH
ncbi:MAG TPA: hypothetical protein VGO59_08770 [Verrucomicrobiae bacterium]|jgi:hypothetical protein